MKRRRFIKSLTTLPIAMALLSLTSSPNAKAASTQIASQRFRGTADGRVFESPDEGKSWQQCAHFGSACAIRRPETRSDTLIALIEIQGYPFALESGDGRLWRTPKSSV